LRVSLPFFFSPSSHPRDPRNPRSNFDFLIFPSYFCLQIRRYFMKHIHAKRAAIDLGHTDVDQIQNGMAQRAFLRSLS
jgi:hypothetical protein